MPCGSKMRSTRSISCTWYCTVRRSSKSQLAFGPTASCRVRLCASTRARKASRSRAYCSSVMRSAALSCRASITSQSVSEAQQSERVLRRALRLREEALDLLAGHRTVAAVVIGLGALDTLCHRAADLRRGGPELALHAVGAVVPGAALDHLDGRARDQLECVAGLQPEILHAQMAGHVVGHLAEGLLEVGAQQAVLVAQHQVLERVEG